MHFNNKKDNQKLKHAGKQLKITKDVKLVKSNILVLTKFASLVIFNYLPSCLSFWLSFLLIFFLYLYAMAENLYLLTEVTVYRYYFSLISCKVGWTKVCCAYKILIYFVVFFCVIYFFYSCTAADAAHSNLSNFQIYFICQK